ATLMYRNIRWSRRSTSFAVIIVVFVCVATSFQFSTLYTFGHVRGVEHEPYLAFSTAGDTVVVADMDVRAAYSAIIQERLKPIGSYPIAYPLAFAYAAEDTIYAPDHVPPPIAQDYLDALMDDIQGKQPQLVLLRQGQSMNGPGFMNVARYVKARTDIETILERDYEYHGVFSDYEVYVHKTP
ncbi:MAG: hypothetical protein KC547_15295, partial [Anaerolineae bacterium]|nr:hypothetical protein [Anaerolineae bacterium]